MAKAPAVNSVDVPVARPTVRRPICEVITIDRSAQTGGCRMARDAHYGVVNAALRSFAIPDLYIVDGSVLPTQGSANLALTIMALAARAADIWLGPAARNHLVAGSNPPGAAPPWGSRATRCCDTRLAFWVGQMSASQHQRPSLFAGFPSCNFGGTRGSPLGAQSAGRLG
jgi:hypothetical protein